ncbi:MAG: toll/interleukin-1 receptor domain-containing protein [Solirubrobacterales bacterium]|nr:toll/interleukin-1 receptor domain-containing protein [Solirubrobacterales bacterium]
MSETIFISYRRADSAGWAGRLGADLAKRLGSEHVFRDVAMAPGEHVREHIDRVLDRCDVLIAVIGPRWATIEDDHGRRRLDNPDDLVRREVARALARPDVQVIPVLVDGARLPSREALPPDLVALRDRNAVDVTDARWDYDVGRLLGHVGEEEGEEPTAAGWSPWGGWAMAGAAALAALPAAALTAPLRDRRAEVDLDRSLPIADKADAIARRLGYYVIERGALWALAGALAMTAGVLAVRAARGRASLPGNVLLALAAGALGGALGAVAYIALKDLPTEPPPEWLVQAVHLGVTGAVAGGVFARLVDGATAGECRLAGIAGGVLAGALTPTLAGEASRGLILALQAALVAGAVGAVLAAAAHRGAAPAPRAAPATRARAA